MGDTTRTTLSIRPWPDRVIDGRGFDPTSAYVEWAWLPVIGPSTTSAYRRLTAGLDASPEGYELDVADLGRSLGLSSNTGCHSQAFRVAARLAVLGLARWEDNGTLAVRRKAPSLAGRHGRSRNSVRSCVPPAEPRRQVA